MTQNTISNTDSNEGHGTLNGSLSHEVNQLPPGMVKTIQETLSRIAASLDLQEVLRTITENARRLVGSDVAQVNLYDRETGRVWVGVRDDGRPEKPASPPRPEGLTMQVIRHGAPVIVNDVLSHPRFANYQPAREWGVQTWAGFPIKREEAAVGVLMVAFVQPHRLDQRGRNALELLAIQAAVAIENARLFEAEQERRQMADALAEVSRILSATLDLSDLLDLTLEQLGQVIRYDSCAISLLEGDEQMRVVAGRGFPDLEKVLQLSFNLSGSVMSGKVVRDRAVVVVRDARQEPRWRPKGEYARRIMSWIGVPLIARGEVLGVLTVDSLTPGVYNAADAEKVAAFAHHVAVAIERARLFEAEQERRHIAEALSRTVSVLTSTLDPGEVLELVLDSLQSVVAYDSSAIFLRQGNRLVLTAGRGFPESAKTDDFSFYINDSALEPILTEEGQPMIISDVLTSEQFRRAEGTEYIRSWIGAPLWARGKLVGLLTVDHSRPGMYSEKDTKKVMDFANQAAIAIENARLHASVQVHAEELELRVEDRTVELRREKEKTEAILRCVADGVVVTGLEGEILLANPVATRWLTVKVNGQPAPNRPLRQFIAQLAQTTEVGNAQRGEFPLGSNTVTLEAHAARLFEDGVALGIVVVLRDVTHQQELDRLKSQFIASISHELRTPLANVKLYLSLLRRGKEEKRARYLKVATEETNRLEELIQDLLDFSRLDVASDKASYEPLHLEEIVRQVLSPYRSRANSKGIVMAEHFAPGLPSVFGDRHQLARVFTDLLDNALNYTPVGGQVTVEIRPLSIKDGHCADVNETQGLRVPDVPDGEWVGAIVADTGIGILPEDLPYIFERFYRGGQAETLSLPGTGLGLPVVWEILNQHGGHIAVSSVVGEGSLFVIFFPSHPAEAVDV